MIEKITEGEFIRVHHINAGIDAMNILNGDVPPPAEAVTGFDSSRNTQQVIIKKQRAFTGSAYVPMNNAFECRADALDPAADGLKICCVGGCIHLPSGDTYDVPAILFDVPQTLQTVWLSIFPDDAMPGVLSLQQEYGAAHHVKIAELNPDGSTYQFWKSDVFLETTGGTSGLSGILQVPTDVYVPHDSGSSSSLVPYIVKANAFHFTSGKLTSVEALDFASSPKPWDENFQQWEQI